MLDRKPNSGPTTVGAYEAKTKFSELIARAEKGESFVVTKNGRPVAESCCLRRAAFDRAGAQGRCRHCARRDVGAKVSRRQKTGGTEARLGY